MMLWLNGEMVSAEAARLDPADRGFTLADGLFETMLCRNETLEHAARHFARLRQSAAVFGLDLPYPDAVLHLACARLAADLPEAAIRLTLSRGPASRGVLPLGADTPTVLITAAPAPATLPPARLIIASCTRRNEFSPLSRHKTLNYGDSILARREAAQAGADDAILLNTRGLVAEATASTLFLRLAGQLVTPPIEDGALPGIRRGLILERGEAIERSIAPAELAETQGGFLANALGMREIASIRL